jgi:molybdate-binding protein
VFYDPKGVPIFDTFSGEVSVNGLIRIHIGKCHFTTVKLGDINTINGKSVNSALDEAGDDHFRLVELLR